ncbi:MAG: alpha-1,6-mannanase [Tannerellaceae bacterium]|nr:alpha-1,6-mannanase [Tannerellaceae bacterium]
MKKYFILGIILLMITSCEVKDEYTYISPIPAEVSSWTALADSSGRAFIENFWNNDTKCFNDRIDGYYSPYSYWPHAHGLDVLVDIYLRTKDETVKQYIYDAHAGIKERNYAGDTFWNNYYDDMAWHGVAQLRVLQEVDGSWANYEESAKQLWEWITEGWTDDDGGGIAWNHEDNAAGKSKGLPSNGPACIIAARRAQKYPDEVINGYTNLEWAHRIYDWMRYNRVILSTGRVYEHIDDTNGDYSYDVGTFIGSALELYDITGEITYMNDAIKAGHYHIRNNINSSNRVMTDYGEQVGDGGVTIVTCSKASSSVTSRYLSSILIYLQKTERSLSIVWNTMPNISGIRVLRNHPLFFMPQVGGNCLKKVYSGAT